MATKPTSPDRPQTWAAVSIILATLSVLLLVPRLTSGDGERAAASTGIGAGAVAVAAQVRAVSANVGRGRPAAQCKAYDAVHRTAVLPEGANTIVGWQEVGEADGDVNEAACLARSFPTRRGWNNSGTWTHTPITRRDDSWDTTRTWSVLAMRGIRGVSPNRWLHITRVYNREHEQPFTLINTHFVAQPFRAGRTRLWWAHWRHLQRVANNERRSTGGRHVVITCDCNRLDVPPIDHGRVVAHRGLDWIFAMPRWGWISRPVTTGSRHLGVDGHAVIWAGIRFTKGS